MTVPFPAEQADHPQKAEGDRDSNEPVRLTLKVLPPERDMDVRVEVRVRNTGDQDLLWDREFSLPLSWTVQRTDGRSLDLAVVSKVERPLLADSRQRFLTLKPEEEVAKVVVLNRAVRDFEYSTANVAGEDGESFHIVEGHERLVRFVAPKDVESMRVTVSTAVFGDYILAASQWLGFDARGSLHAVSGITSNTVVVSLDQP